MDDGHESVAPDHYAIAQMELSRLILGIKIARLNKIYIPWPLSSVLCARQPVRH